MSWDRIAGRIAGRVAVRWKRLQGSARRRRDTQARKKQLAEWTAERDKIDPIYK